MVKNREIKKTVLLFSGILFFLISSLTAQNISSIDFENLKSSDLTDQQIEQMWQRAQSQGYSVSQLQQLALARGMSPSEVNKLMQRFRSISPNSSSTSDSSGSTGDLRSVTISPKSNTVDKAQSNIFGASLFRNENITFIPSLNIPTPENYQLGVGDELIINLWGAAEHTYNLLISPEGTITIDNLGPLYVNGLEIKEARIRIKEALSKIYSGLKVNGNGSGDTQVRVSLGNIRSINVTVLGNAAAPGTYTVPSLATAFNVLYVSGGPSSKGSFRKIKIIRNGQLYATMDVYDFLVKGEQPNNIRLRENDIIKIEPYITQVELSGKVKRAGIFELLPGETLEDLLTYAGGFDKGAYTDVIKIIRETATQKEIKDISYPQQKDVALKNGDSIQVGTILDRFDNRITIEGAVYRPGNYELSDTTSLYSLIQRAEGLTPNVFTNRGLIYRNPDNIETEVIAFDLKKLMTNPGAYDIKLLRNDRVVISSIPELQEDFNITVSGAVQNSGTFSFAKKMTLKDAILKAKGFKDDAAPYRIEVARRIRDTDSAYVPAKIVEQFSFSIDEELKLDPDEAGFELNPFDKIYVRSSPAYYQQQEVTIKGQVLFPGTYTLNTQTTRISDLILMAGGLTEFAYTPGANLSRINDKNEDEEILNDSLVTTSGFESNRLKVGIELQKILGQPGSKYNLLLEAGDILEIPKELETVKVVGELLKPSSVRYDPKKSFLDYVRAGGGVNTRGELKNAYIVYANGEVDRTKKFLFFRNYPDVKKGATIIIPKEKERRTLTPQERVGILTAVVSMAAIVTNVLTR